VHCAYMGGCTSGGMLCTFLNAHVRQEPYCRHCNIPPASRIYPNCTDCFSCCAQGQNSEPEPGSSTYSSSTNPLYQSPRAALPIPHSTSSLYQTVSIPKPCTPQLDSLDDSLYNTTFNTVMGAAVPTQPSPCASPTASSSQQFRSIREGHGDGMTMNSVFHRVVLKWSNALLCGGVTTELGAAPNVS